MRMILATTANAIMALGPQLVALVVLVPADFGRFSLVYLVFALGSSLLLSIVCEAASHHDDPAQEATTRLYLAASGWISAATAPLSALLALGSGASWGAAAALATAVALACYRVAARFREVATGLLTTAIAADLAGAIALGASTAVALTLSLDPLFALSVAWAVSGATSTLVGLRRRPSGPASLSRWIRAHRGRIGQLLRDSIVLDLSSIGTPYAIAPLLGIVGFSVYRAVSNVAAPVRLLLNPMRPLIATSALPQLLGPRRLGQVAVASLGSGVAAGAALVAIDASGLEIGVLTMVSAHAFACGVFVAANLSGHYLYLVARTHLDGARLWRARVSQSVISIALPLTGALTRDTTLAVNAFAASAVLNAAVWWLYLGRRRLRP